MAAPGPSLKPRIQWVRAPWTSHWNTPDHIWRCLREGQLYTDAGYGLTPCEAYREWEAQRRARWEFLAANLLRRPHD